MKAFFDTSVLVAALVEEHPHHAPAAAILNTVFSAGERGYISAHGLVEVYAVLTRAPFPLRIYPDEAWKMLEEGILPHVDVIGLDGADYRRLVEFAAGRNWSGGRVYDLVHLAVARMAGCDRLYTFNVKDFRAMAGEFPGEICAP